jgi:hypothetical protein
LRRAAATGSDRAAAGIGALAQYLGFAPIKLGGLLVQARGNSWGQLVFKGLVEVDG